MVVLATGTAPNLLTCLRSVADQAHSTPYEVVLVLNGVTDGLASLVAEAVTGRRLSALGSTGGSPEGAIWRHRTPEGSLYCS